jgi:Flp pilus assembly pilin Flp
VLSWPVVAEDRTLDPTPHRVADTMTARRRRRRGSSWRGSSWRDRRAISSVEYAVIAGVLITLVFSVSSPFATALGILLDHMTNAL